MILSGLAIHTENGVLPSASILVNGNHIHTIASYDIASPDSGHEVIRFPENHHLIPGMIDLHIHGVAGADIMDATPEALTTLCDYLPREGTTGFLATTMTRPASEIEAALVNIHKFMTGKTPEGAELLGVHLEGPFLSPHKMGAQSGKFILKPDRALLKHWQNLSHNLIRQVTFAPEECEDDTFLPWLVQNQVIASLGHSAATFLQTQNAIRNGCHHATHLFNAMTGMHHRDPGAVGAILLSRDITAEIIADGVHVHPDMVRLAYQIKGREKLVLVTDAMRAKCLDCGVYDLGGQAVTADEKSAHLSDGTLAGSVLKMIDAANNMRRFAQCDLQDVIRMSSENPARLLNLFHRKGSIAEGKEADLVVLDESFNVVMTICRGRIVYQSQQAPVIPAKAGTHLSCP